MKFTDTQFIQAVELIQTVEQGKTRKDKRRAARTAIRVPVGIKLTVDSSSDWGIAKLHDISPRGAKLEVQYPMETGSSFLLRLPSKEGNGMAQPLICRVAHCVKERLCYMIGAEFIGQYAGGKSTGKSAGDNAADVSRIQRSILD
jgi:hypothetical protein